MLKYPTGTALNANDLRGATRCTESDTRNVIVEIHTDDGRDLCGPLAFDRPGAIALWRLATPFYQHIAARGLRATILADGQWQTGAAVGLWTA